MRMHDELPRNRMPKAMGCQTFTQIIPAFRCAPHFWVASKSGAFYHHYLMDDPNWSKLASQRTSWRNCGSADQVASWLYLCGSWHAWNERSSGLQSLAHPGCLSAMETMQQSPYLSGLINLLFRCFLARPSRHSLRECPWACSHQTTTCVLGSLAPPIV